MELVYGPIASRRLGRSLGINLLDPTQKLCSFNCSYCDLGPSTVRMNQIKKWPNFPSPENVEQELRQKLRQLSDRQEEIDYICISGNGEPTLHPDLPTVIERILAAKSEIMPKVKTAILTNGAHLSSKRLVAALNSLDDRMVKLDAGNDSTFKVINSPMVRMSPGKLVSLCKDLKEITLQSIFVQGAADNTGDENVTDWIEVVGMIRPKEVHLYTINRQTLLPGITAADENTLYAIASKLKRRTTIETKVFI